MPDLNSILFALVGGITPALLWLWFWLREDKKNPEPRFFIALAFFMGMVAVAVVIPLQKMVAEVIVGTTLMFAAWSIIEEAVKFFLAYVTVLNHQEADEPIDMVVYMVAVALGFAALENVLFLLSPLAGGDVLQTVLTGNLRFVGATLLHVLASATIGVALALAFYRPLHVKIMAGIIGVILAAILHSGFNALILNTSDEHIFRTFALVWIGVVIILALLEWVKQIRRRV